MTNDTVGQSRSVVFLHVMKTGGTTFRGILSSIYGASYHMCHVPQMGAVIHALAKFKCLEFHTLPYHGDFIHMHNEIARQSRWDLLEGRDIFTMLRDPVDQAVSQYFDVVAKRDFIEPAFKANGIPFPESLEQYAEFPSFFNNQLAFLAGKYQLDATVAPLGPQDLAEVKRVLVDLNVHVGLTERYSEALHVFETVTGQQIPSRTVINRNQNRNRPPLEAIPAELKERIRQQSALDIELYDFAKNLFEQEIASCASTPVYDYKNVLLDDPLKSQSLQVQGYTIEPFLDEADVQALTRLHHKTTPIIPIDYYVTAFGNPDTRREVYEGITAIVSKKVKELAPGYRILMGLFVTKRARSIQGFLGVHQDYTMIDHTQGWGLNVWCPLSNVDSDNGCLRVIEGSHVFSHISATPPNPAPFQNILGELQADHLKELPMSAGSAFLFDTRLLHASNDNRTDSDRTAVLLNLVPENLTPRLYQWNKNHPDRLEIYEFEDEFLVRFPPNQYIENAEQYGARLVGFVDYKLEMLTSADLERLIPVRPPPVTQVLPDQPVSRLRQLARWTLRSVDQSPLPDGAKARLRSGAANAYHVASEFRRTSRNWGGRRLLRSLPFR